jgi:hypothetical protein
MNSVFVRTFEGMENGHVVDNASMVNNGPASVVDNEAAVDNTPVSSVNTPNKKKDMMDILTSEK